MRRVRVTLSSEFTPVFKFVFPALFGITTAGMMFLAPEGNAALGPVARVLFWLAVVLLLWYCGGLKAVHQEGTELVISNYRDEHRVPASQIERVKRSAGAVSVRFREPTPFGRTIRFVPEASLLDMLGMGWLDDEPVRHLRQMAQLDAEHRRRLREGERRALEGEPPA